MATIVIGDKAISVPDIEVLAAFRMSHSTAEREGFPRTAERVQGYLEELQEASDALRARELELHENGRKLGPR